MAGVIGVNPSMTGLASGPKSKAWSSAKLTRAIESSRSRRTLSRMSGAAGLVTDAEDQPGDLVQDERPPGPGLLADVQLLDGR